MGDQIADRARGKWRQQHESRTGAEKIFGARKISGKISAGNSSGKRPLGAGNWPRDGFTSGKIQTNAGSKNGVGTEKSLRKERSPWPRTETAAKTETCCRNLVDQQQGPHNSDLLVMVTN
jgi:hypothetical protein